jgi:phage terminase Nu1 subunit (DNA packaging protein)
MIVNKVQLASIIGKSESWITDAQKGHDFPIEKRGRGRAGQLYDTAKVIEWLEKRQINHLTGNQGLIDLDEAKRRKMAAEAGLAELELMKEQGVLVEIEKIADDFGEQLSNFRAKMISIPSKCAAQVLTCDNVQEIKSILEDSINEALNEVRGIGNFNADGELEGGDSQAVLPEAEATTKTDDLAMG